MGTESKTRLTGALLIVQGLLMFVPLAILGQAIGWPASLDEPAAQILPRIYAQSSAVRLGYLSYLGYSMLFWPTALLTLQVIGGEQQSRLVRLAAGFALLSTLARCIGIVRWLVAMPVLAASYASTPLDDPRRATIELLYGTLNDFGGSIGELLGVSLFAALWLGLVAAAIVRERRLPRWLGSLGALAAAALLCNLGEIFGLDLGPVTMISVSLLQIWFLLMGALLLRARGAAGQVVANYQL